MKSDLNANLCTGIKLFSSELSRYHCCTMRFIHSFHFLYFFFLDKNYGKPQYVLLKNGGLLVAWDRSLCGPEHHELNFIKFIEPNWQRGRVVKAPGS